MVVNELLYQYWGKAHPPADGGPAYHLLPYHCLDVAAVAQVLLEQSPLLRKRFSNSAGIAEEPLIPFVVFFIALHDCGKFSEGFQNLAPSVFFDLRKKNSSKPYSLRHDALGLFLWKKESFLSQYIYQKNWFDIGAHEYWDFESWNDLFTPIVSAVVGHHGYPPSFSHLPPLKEHFDLETQDVIRHFADELAGLFFPNGLLHLHLDYDEHIKQLPYFSWMLAGLTILADWLGSDANIFKYVKDPMPLKQYWQDVALPRAQQALYESGVLVPKPAKSQLFKDLFPDINAASPLQSILQSQEIPCSAQLFILEEMTGAGKTEAAILLAYRLMEQQLAEGIFFGLPTMATANAMYKRLAQTYRKLFDSSGPTPSLILSHSARHLSKEYRQSIGTQRNQDLSYSKEEESASNFCAKWLADSRKTSLLAAIGIGTIDQALFSVLTVKHQALRLFGLGRSVLIVDEVHAYDPYMHKTLCNLLKFQAVQGSSVILLSATLPENMKRELCESFQLGLGSNNLLEATIDYPLITHVALDRCQLTPVPFDKNRTVQVTFINEISQAFEYVLAKASQGSCVCWIRNTVTDALTAYETLMAHYPQDKITLFHSRFAMEDRLNIEDKVLRLFGKKSTLEQRQGQILIATQVVEQSLDLDFDDLITDLAPIELLLQRAGRLHRHERYKRPEPVLLILSPKYTETPNEQWYAQMFPKAAFVYPRHGQLWLGTQLLMKMGQFQMPKDARKLIEGVYSSEAGAGIPDTFLNREIKQDGKDSASKSMAKNNNIQLEQGYLSNQIWSDEVHISSRLDDEKGMTTVRLLRNESSALLPWASGDFAWELSQVNIRGKYKELSDARLERVKQKMPDEGKWVTSMVLSKGSDAFWYGQMEEGKSEPVQFKYNHSLGLQIANGT